MFPTWKDWDITYTRQGLAARRFRTLLKSLALVAFISGIVKLRRSGRSLTEFLKDFIRNLLLRGSNLLQGVAGKV
jgi:hypothetical protein